MSWPAPFRSGNPSFSNFPMWMSVVPLPRASLKRQVNKLGFPTGIVLFINIYNQDSNIFNPELFVKRSSNSCLRYSSIYWKLYDLSNRLSFLNLLTGNFIYIVRLLCQNKVYYSLTPDSVYPNLPEEGCQQIFLSLLRERALCALYLYRSLVIKDISLHYWVESVINPEQDI